jgi:hypothetical protein
VVHTDRPGEPAGDEQSAGDVGEEHSRAPHATEAVPPVFSFLLSFDIALAAVQLPIFYLGLHTTVTHNDTLKNVDIICLLDIEIVECSSDLISDEICQPPLLDACFFNQIKTAYTGEHSVIERLFWIIKQRSKGSDKLKITQVFYTTD